MRARPLVPLVTVLLGAGVAQAGGAPAPATHAAAAADFPFQAVALCPRYGSASPARGVLKLEGGVVGITARELAPSPNYAVWLFNDAADAVPLGFAQYDERSRKLNGSIATLPKKAERYRFVVITRERDADVSRPRHIVLRSRRISLRTDLPSRRLTCPS